MNILDKSAIRSCTSCQMCAAICPSDAISIKLNEDGFYRPYIDNDKCTNCSLCVKSCYKFDNAIQLTTDEDLNVYSHYAAYAKDKKVLRSTTSGGIADILAKQLIIEGYKVIGVAYDEQSNKVKHLVAEDAITTDLFRGSKYIQSYSVDAFKLLVNTVKTEKYAVFGLPCQIYSLSKYLAKKGLRDKVVLIDLYCHGCPSMLAWSKLSEEVADKTGFKNFQLVNWREKVKGWGSFYVVVVVDGKIIYKSTPLNDEFYHLFFSNQILNESCQNCTLRSTLKYTDIRLGDFWGPKFRGNTKGVSGATIVTERGRLIFDSIAGEIYAQNETFSEFLPYQSWNLEYDINQSLRNELLQNLKSSKSMKEVVKPLLHTYSAFEKIKILLRQVLFYLPNSWIGFLKSHIIK